MIFMKLDQLPSRKITQLTFFSKSSLYNILNKYVQFNTKPEELTKGALLLSFVRCIT